MQLFIMLSNGAYIRVYLETNFGRESSNSFKLFTSGTRLIYKTLSRLINLLGTMPSYECFFLDFSTFNSSKWLYYIHISH